MKTFKLIGIAILATITCTNVSSCKNDEENNIDTREKKLVSIDFNGDLGWKFSYNSKGQLIASYGGSCGDITYFWENNAIVSSHLDQPINLDKNLISSMTENDDANRVFTYNSAGQLIKEIIKQTYYTTSYTTLIEYVWQNDKLTNICSKSITTGEYGITEGGTIREYTYSGKACKGYFPCLPYSFFGDNYDIFWAHPEIIGLRTSQLPDKYYWKDTYDDDEKICQYTYTFDKDGYVQSCTETTLRHYHGETTTYSDVFTFTWE